MKKSYQRLDGLRKRCHHPRKQWSECEHPWYYDVAIRKVRTRGVLGTFINRREAEDAFEAVKRRLDAGEQALPTPPAVQSPHTVDTIESFARRWLQFIPLVKKPSTVGFYTGHLTNHVIPALGSTPIAALTRSQCKQFALTLREKKIARVTMVGILTTLSALISAAVDDDDCPVTANPAARLTKLLRDPNDKKKRRLEGQVFRANRSVHAARHSTRSLPRVVSLRAVRAAHRHAVGGTLGPPVGRH